MNEPIRVGDLVAIVRSCCVQYMDGVPVYRVASIHTPPHDSECFYCGTVIPTCSYAAPAEDEWGTPLQWLKRIPPLGDLEDEKHEEAIHA